MNNSDHPYFFHKVEMNLISTRNKIYKVHIPLKTSSYQLKAFWNKYLPLYIFASILFRALHFNGKTIFASAFQFQISPSARSKKPQLNLIYIRTERCRGADLHLLRSMKSFQTLNGHLFRSCICTRDKRYIRVSPRPPYMSMDPNDNNPLGEKNDDRQNRNSNAKCDVDSNSNTNKKERIDQKRNCNTKQELKALPLRSLLSKLRRYDIRIPPTATRQDLEDLILQHQSSTVARESEGSRARRSSKGKSHNNRFQSSRSGTSSGSDRHREKRSRSNMRVDTDVRSRPPNDRDGNRRGTRNRVSNKAAQLGDTPGARDQRVRRQQRQRRNNSPSIMNNIPLDLPDIDLDIDNYVDLNKAKRLGRRAVESATNVGKRITELKRRPKNTYDEDENGVREADWYYVSRDEDMRQPKPSTGARRQGQRSRMWSRPRAGSRSRAVKEVLSKERKPRRESYGDDDRIRIYDKVAKREGFGSKKKILKKRKVAREGSNRNLKDTRTPIDASKLPLALPPKLENVVYIPDLNSDSKVGPKEAKDKPDSFYQEENKEGQGCESASSPDDKPWSNPKLKKGGRPYSKSRGQRSARRNRNSSDAAKKIYSVYPPQADEDDIVDLEELYGKAAASAIDYVGELLADVTGGDYDYSNRNRNETFKQANSSATTGRRQRRNGKLFTSGRRYWKDRLSERVDYALGVHEDGKYYKSWQDQIRRQKAREREGGNDPVSIFYGKQPKQRGPQKKAPFWEEDGSLASLFFGRTQNGQHLAFNKLFESDMSITLLVSAGFKSMLAVLSYVCRWATCRGALPQPIVVFLLGASALSAPRRKKVMTLVITLLAIRTVAEALHGYVYANGDWEYDGDYEEESDCEDEEFESSSDNGGEVEGNPTQK